MNAVLPSRDEADALVPTRVDHVAARRRRGGSWSSPGTRCCSRSAPTVGAGVREHSDFWKGPVDADAHAGTSRNVMGLRRARRRARDGPARTRRPAQVNEGMLLRTRRPNDALEPEAYARRHAGARRGDGARRRSASGRPSPPTQRERSGRSGGDWPLLGVRRQESAERFNDFCDDVYVMVAECSKGELQRRRRRGTAGPDAAPASARAARRRRTVEGCAAAGAADGGVGDVRVAAPLYWAPSLRPDVDAAQEPSHAGRRLARRDAAHAEGVADAGAPVHAPRGDRSAATSRRRRRRRVSRPWRPVADRAAPGRAALERAEVPLDDGARDSSTPSTRSPRRRVRILTY